MENKIFRNKKIVIRNFSKTDLRNGKKFQNFINSVVKEDVQMFINKKFSLKNEKKWLEEQCKEIKNKKKVFLIAEKDGVVIGTTCIGLGFARMNHVGILEICVRGGYRGMGIGECLTKKIIKLAKNKLKIKFVRLSVFSTNKPAISLYKKSGFKKIAIIPKQIKYRGKLIDEIIMIK
jgi:RimJ/RimL family protein N-acetyltransferase